MKIVAKFEKVSFEQYRKDFYMKDKNVNDVYDNIILPKRATKYSAGYDFFLPYDITILPGQTVLIPSGVRVKINENWVLQIFPRSSLGFKYQLQLDNTVGIIDADYYNSLNEGHIFVKLTNHSTQTLELLRGTGYIQGLFFEYGITEDDNTQQTRIGGIGSTSK